MRRSFWQWMAWRWFRVWNRDGAGMLDAAGFGLVVAIAIGCTLGALVGLVRLFGG
jgi:hypothetical protein